MRVIVLAWGTHGDIQPYVALALGLQSAGWEVRFAAPAMFREFVAAYGLEYWELPGDPRQIVANPITNTRLETSNPFHAMRHITGIFTPLIKPMLMHALRAAQDCDFIIYSPFVWAAAHLAEALSIPCALALLCPLYPTADFPNPMTVPKGSVGSLLNRATHAMSLQLTWQPYQGEINRLRRSVLGLAPSRTAGSMYGSIEQYVHHLMGYSSLVVPKPVDWPASVHVTGYWFTPEVQWEPPEKLLRFLTDGPAPVYVGFGSMGGDAQHDTSVVLKTLELLGQRAVIARGWGGLNPESLPDSVLMVDFVPHAWLFPRVKAVVHHGGSGTVAAALRAGVPQVVVPFVAEQPFWGHRLHKLGVSPAPLPHRMFSIDRFTSVLRRVINDPVMCQRAAALREQICAEAGVARAVGVIEQLAADRSRSARLMA